LQIECFGIFFKNSKSWLRTYGGSIFWTNSIDCATAHLRQLQHEGIAEEAEVKSFIEQENELRVGLRELIEPSADERKESDSNSLTAWIVVFVLVISGSIAYLSGCDPDERWWFESQRAPTSPEEATPDNPYLSRPLGR
jgi:hypothetical protein